MSLKFLEAQPPFGKLNLLGVLYLPYISQKARLTLGQKPAIINIYRSREKTGERPFFIYF